MTESRPVVSCQERAGEDRAERRCGRKPWEGMATGKFALLTVG